MIEAVMISPSNNSCFRKLIGEFAGGKINSISADAVNDE